MRAYCYHRDGTLALSDVDAPRPQKGELLLKVLACSICGTDLRTYRFGNGKLDEGRVIGHEIVGRIVETGGGVPDAFRVGDMVAIAPAIGCGECPSCQKGRTNMCDHLTTIGFQYNGGFSEYVVIPAQAVSMGNAYLLPKDTGLDPSAFSLSEPLACVINAQTYLQVQQGDTVAIFGSGVIGCMHAELARLSGARRVMMLEMDAQRIGQVRPLLEDVEFICVKEKDPVEEVLSRTQGGGADVAIIACSMGNAQAQGLRLLAKCGRISLFGGLPKESIGFLDSNLIHYRELGVFGVHASTPDQNKQAMEMIRCGRIDVGKYITRRYLLEDIGQAFSDVGSGKVLKAVIVDSL